MSARGRRNRSRRRRGAAKRAKARRRILAGVGLGAGAVLASAPAAQADVDTFTVNASGDAGDGTCEVAVNECTLRDAMLATDDTDTTDLDTIVFAASVTGTITLAGTQLPSVDEPLYVNGPGAGTLAVSGGDVSRVIGISTGAAYDVTIEGLTVQDGLPATGVGGAISNFDADLVVRNAVVSGSSSAPTGADGGGISSSGGSLAIESSTISGNSTGGAGDGGGISADQSTLTIESSTISGNSTSANTAFGGGIYADGSEPTITNSTISGNFTTDPDSDGGGAYIKGASDLITIGESTISGNSTAGTNSSGGGIRTVGSNVLHLVNSTVSGNSTAGQFGDGGGIAMSTTQPGIYSSTISGNFTTGPAADGGGMYSLGAALDPYVVNTIIANNSVAVTSVGSDLASDGTTISFSLVEGTDSGILNDSPAGSSITGQDPQLGTLAANGGPTETHLLSATSPVLDKGTADGPGLSTLNDDQRGLPRPFDVPSIVNSPVAGGNASDMGAVELTAAEVPAPPPASGAAPTPAKKKKKCKKKRKKGKTAAAAGKKCKKKKK